MSKPRPSLLYLAIYNPTLRPDVSAVHDNVIDEDAEEQAQILFYTSRDRFVSRDKILRQVGLAKALVNFAEIFHSTDPCQNVHSQSRRMVMVSPEPNFWVHVAVELAKTPRVPTTKLRVRDKGKGKATEESQVPQLEYHDGSFHDSAIRAHLIRGYEQFKLTHGSFCSILSSLGQQALELQLERFFTVWAWTWDVDKDFRFGINLGLPLHPSYSLILPVIDTFSSQIPEGVDVLVLTQSHVAPSSGYRNSQYPVALARHLMNHLASAREPATASVSTTQPERLDSVSCKGHDEPRTLPMETPPSGGFLGVSISMSMDVRKWAWPSFVKESHPKGLAATTSNGGVLTACGCAEAQVDQSALEDAIASENSFALPSEKPSALDDHEKGLEKLDDDTSTPRPSRAPSLDSLHAPPNCSLQTNGTPATLYCEKTQFTWTDVFLAPRGEPLTTSRKRVYLLKRGQHALALLNSKLEDVEVLVKPSVCLLEDVDRIISEGGQRDMAASLPSATKILQPKNSHVLKNGDYMTTSGGGDLSSDYLFEAKGLLDREPAVIEVFSRGLHPQHWHVASRVLTDPFEDGKGEAYLEVSRKEATLSDADNILRGLYKTYV